jgi:hypothetical protein
MVHRKLLITSATIAAVLITACDGQGPPTAPSTSPTVAAKQAQAGNSDEHAASSSSKRSGALHATKECSAYTGLAGAYCTITSSNIKAIPVGSKVVYAKAKDPTSLDSDVTLYPPGKGKSVAYGHVVLDFVTRTGVITFSGGTGKFKHFQATAVVSYLGAPNWAWDGTFSFGKGEKGDNHDAADDDNGDDGDEN